MEYSYKKGIWKGVKAMLIPGLSILGTAAVFAGYSDVPIADLLYTVLKQVFGGLTVAGLLTFILNWVKNK